MASIPPDAHAIHLPDDRRRIVSGNGLAMGSMMLWAEGFPAAELLLQDWHPITLMTLRLSLALAVLFPLWLLVDGARVVRAANWGRGILIGILGFGVATNLLLFAQWFTDPVTVTLIATTTPVSATLIEVLGRQRRLNRSFLLGLTAAVIGGAIAVGGNLSAEMGWGVVMAISSCVCFTWASNAAVRDFPDLSPVGRSTITFVGAALLTFVIFAVSKMAGYVEFPTDIDARQVGLLVIYAVAAMALSQILFIAAVGKLGIAITSFHSNIAPFYVMMIMVGLGGSWDWRAVIGALVVGAGVAISQNRVVG